MAEWFYEGDSLTAGGYPKEYGTAEDDFIFEKHVFVHRAARRGGEDDKMPRRVIALGGTREEAISKLHSIIRMYDRAAVLPTLGNRQRL